MRGHVLNTKQCLQVPTIVAASFLAHRRTVVLRGHEAVGEEENSPTLLAILTSPTLGWGALSFAAGAVFSSGRASCSHRPAATSVAPTSRQDGWPRLVAKFSGQVAKGSSPMANDSAPFTVGPSSLKNGVG